MPSKKEAKETADYGSRDIPGPRCNVDSSGDQLVFGSPFVNTLMQLRSRGLVGWGGHRAVKSVKSKCG